jgi:hypothetical protein
MNRLPRRLAGIAATAAIAAGGLVATAAPAHASTAQDCLNTLQRATFAYAGPEGVVIPLAPSGEPVTPFFHVLDDSRCAGIVASIGISKRDGSGFRNRLASLSRVEGLVTAYWSYKPTWKDAGTWVIRQIAVKKGDTLAARAFDPATAASIQVRRASVLTGYSASDPLGKQLQINKGGYLAVQGFLKAYGSDGRLHTLAAGQRIQIQVRPHGTTAPYRTARVTTTSKFGYYGTLALVGRSGPLDVRVVYRTPYQTVASDFTFVGVARTI